MQLNYTSILRNIMPGEVLDFPLEYLMAKILSILLVLILVELAKRLTLSSLSRVDGRIKQVGVSGHTKRIVKNTIGYGFNFAAILAILWILNVLPLVYTLLTAAGVAGIVIGFGMRDISSNFLSGLIISIERPYEIGDTAEVAGYLGSVENISMRMTTLKLMDGKIVYIPNANILNSSITNYTRSVQRRVELQVTVSYESDLTLAVKTVKESMEANKNVIAEKDSFVLVDSLADSGILLKAFYWVDTGKSSYVETKNSVVEDITKALKDNGIGIPYNRIEVINKN